MQKSFAILSLILMLGCSGESNSTNPPNKVIAAEVPGEVMAKDIARALGMNSFVVRVPDDADMVPIGFTYYTKDGIAKCGVYVPFKKGTIVKVIYWIDNEQIRYSMLSDNDGSLPGRLDIKEFKHRLSVCGVPDKRRIYGIDQTITKWSMGESSGIWDSAINEISEDEIGLIVVRHRTEFKPKIKRCVTSDPGF